MKYIVGYQHLDDEDKFLSALLKHREHIREVYFPWDDFPNGRGSFTGRTGILLFESQRRLVDDLKMLRNASVGMNLLLNGNCYGANSLFRTFFTRIGDAVNYINNNIGLTSVTTSSPVITGFIRKNFPELEVRASVNMEIGSTQGMDYIGELFDAYYLKRELNHDLPAIKSLKQWCDRKGKKLYMLVNSGCLNHFSVHNFHDNLVAHENEIAAMDNAFAFNGICHDYLRQADKRTTIISDSSFVRPENIHWYEPYFDAVKLATRNNRNPTAVIEVYVNNTYTGGVMNLIEPDHSEAFHPYLLENTRFPDVFGIKTLNCDKHYDTCLYWREVFNMARINLNDNGGIYCADQ